VAEGKTGFHINHTWQSGLTNGKLEPETPAAQPPKCPECNSQKVWRDGLRYLRSNRQPIQRWLCRSCGLRFSEPLTQSQVKLNIFPEQSESFHSTLNLHNRRVAGRRHSFEETEQSSPFIVAEDIGLHNLTTVGKELNNLPYKYSKRRVCVPEDEAKNLAEVESRIKEKAAGATTKPESADMKGKIIEYAWWLKKQGYAETTILVYTNAVEVLAKRGANIFDPESAKDALARQKWGEARKNVVIMAYTLFLTMCGMTWEQPIHRKPVRKLPFIPTESEIDQLIAGCGKKTSAFLQLLKETAMRGGEANRLEWSDIDFTRRTITLNYPEKGGNPRIFKVSQKLISMLDSLPKKNRKVFGNVLHWHQATFRKSRKRISEKLQNPRLLNIHFHTLRHWKATMLYHQTKDILYVKEFLGHKKIEDTLLYVQIAEVIFKETSDEFTVKVASKPEEISQLLEVGFEYVCEKDGLMFFRKRK